MTKKKHMHLNAFLVQDQYKGLAAKELIHNINEVKSYTLDKNHDLDGMLFVKLPTEKKPVWAKFAEDVVSNALSELENKSSSAVLIIKIPQATFAFVFGYGRHLLNSEYFVQDFGIKTALNTLDHLFLRGIDTVTLDDQAVQKKAQSSGYTSSDTFGIDISKDILRAVTGRPKSGVAFSNISGGGATFSFSMDMHVSDLKEISKHLINYYYNTSYKDNFAWVDNIRKIVESSEIDKLDQKLIAEIKKQVPAITISVPELVDWDSIYGFSFTRSKQNIKPVLGLDNYLQNLDTTSLKIDTLKKDKLFVFDMNDIEESYSIYKCIYYELSNTPQDTISILFSGQWYEIDNSFLKRINTTLEQIKISTLSFPDIYIWKEMVKQKEKERIESEGDYNVRVTSNNPSFYLLDKQLIKADRTTTPIELCDLLTKDSQFVHVKHRKGGSAGLSHLFAQGNVSAELLLGDRIFRKVARRKLKSINNGLEAVVPLHKFKSSDAEIVFLILGEGSATLKNNLPFFSKVNLSRVFENLSQKGFNVSIAGVDKISKPTP